MLWRRFGFLCIIATARSHDYLAMLRRLCLDTDDAISAQACRVGGMIPDGVLVPDISCNSCRNGVHILQGIGEVRNAASLLRQPLQSVSRSSCFCLFGLEKQPYGIDYRSSQVLHTADCLLQIKP